MSEPLTKDKIVHSISRSFSEEQIHSELDSVKLRDLKSALELIKENINKEISNPKFRPKYELGLVEAFRIIMDAFPAIYEKEVEKK